ncbi:hypothetical protein QBC36DRAFT_378437 [Triangularia setosa]|uniref:Transmembrane protein n=1 Tax=Triangularia setosa TaxID=2587417 RepID=A0AAN6W7L9_9PEZI|nr:hypothetical protein QBC36DRAFT_378437 [Podospora setosa]
MGRRHGSCYMCKKMDWNRTLVPLFLSLGAFISGVMALFAGRTWNIMEDFELLLVNAVVLADWTKFSSHWRTSTLASLDVEVRNEASSNDFKDILKKRQLEDCPHNLKRVGPDIRFLLSPRNRNMHGLVCRVQTTLTRNDEYNIVHLNILQTSRVFTLMLTIAMGAYGVFAFFTTWFSTCNPLRHRRYRSTSHGSSIDDASTYTAGLMGLFLRLTVTTGHVTENDHRLWDAWCSWSVGLGMGLDVLPLLVEGFGHKVGVIFGIDKFSVLSAPPQQRRGVQAFVDLTNHQQLPRAYGAPRDRQHPFLQSTIFSTR